ncbi:hypothetical protein J4429_02555 [Candidatus Pacearchaeota archaeon]|nr:hypothetical protein [Candidatus Pacearchaeota archaeon]
MAKNRITSKLKKLEITIYPHIREHFGKKYYQAGILIEEIPGVVDWDYIYYGDTMKKLIGKLVSSKHEWVHHDSYAVQVVKTSSGFERIFSPRHSLLGEISNMLDIEHEEFKYKFEKIICRR